MKIIGLLISFLSIAILSLGQSGGTVPTVDYCGFQMTPQFEARLDRNLKVMRSGNYSRSNTLKQVPIVVHLMAKDDGTGRFPEAEFLVELCKLNAQFEPFDIQVYLSKDNFQYHDKDTWYAGNSAATMAALTRKSNAVNIYVLGTVAGLCGYYSPNLDIVVLGSNCLGSFQSLMMHEIGHFFTLPHTFSGLESFPNYQCGNMAPATYEMNDGSNCTTVGDRFCDTGPDYQNEQWNCNGQSQSSCEHIDANSDSFFPNGEFAMSYSRCGELFSNEQASAFHIDYDNRTDLHSTTTLINDTITASIQLSEPADNATSIGFTEQFISWFSVQYSTSYLFQLSTTAAFNQSSLVHVGLTENPWLTYTEGLDQFTDYYWRVKPVNEGYFCAPFSASRKFTTTDQAINVHDIEGVTGIKLYPNPTQGKGEVLLALNAERNMNATVRIYTVDGKLMKSQEMEIESANNNYQIDVNGLSAGLYLLSLETELGTIQEKLIVSK